MTPKPYRDAKPSANPAVTRPSIWITIGMMGLLALFARAGVWQLDRAGEKEDLKAKFAANSIVDPATELVPDSAAQRARFRKFLIRGRYNGERQILLENMTAGGQNGYHVLTPFITGDRTVMVNRGWVKADPDRRQLPDVQVANNPRMVLGRLNRFPVPGMRLAAADNEDDAWPRRLLFPTREQIAENIGTDIADYQLLLDPAAEDGFLRDWQALQVGSERNIGYAFQWFSLAALTLGLYIWLGIRWRKKLAEVR